MSTYFQFLMPYGCSQQSLIALYYCILGDYYIFGVGPLLFIWKKNTGLQTGCIIILSWECGEYILSWLWQIELFSVPGPSVSSVYACRIRFCVQWTSDAI